MISWENLKDWQTLVSGVLAVAAAFLGAFLLWKQTAQTKATIEDQRVRELDKARTLAQFHLSDLSRSIVDFAEEIAHILEHKARAEPQIFVEWPAHALEVLANIQLHCGHEERKQFGALFQNMQVLQARLSDHDAADTQINRFDRIQWLLNACMLAEIKSAIEVLFDYCRFQSDKLVDFHEHLPNIETTFFFWNIDLEGGPEDEQSDVSYVHRWLKRTLTKSDPEPWFTKPIRD
jgi:hypothetical protein